MSQTVQTHSGVHVSHASYINCTWLANPEAGVQPLSELMRR
jgi:hypothetical protein